jgi:hypothetical protein
MPRPIYDDRGTNISIGYACFAFSGLINLAIGVLSFVPMDTGAAGVIGIGVMVPAMLAAIVATLIGLGLSLHLRERGLVVLSVLSILNFLEFATEFGPVQFYTAAPSLYGTTALVVSLRALWRRRAVALAILLIVVLLVVAVVLVVPVV